MNAARWLYFAAGFLLLFAVGHTIGFLAFHPKSAAAAAVWGSMNAVPVDSNHTYAGFYTGFGLVITVFLLMAAWLAYIAARLCEKQPGTARSIALAMAIAHSVILLLSFNYFSWPPVLIAALTTFCLFSAAGRLHAGVR